LAYEAKKARDNQEKKESADSHAGSTISYDDSSPTAANHIAPMSIHGPWKKQSVPFASIKKTIKRKERKEKNGNSVLINGEKVYDAVRDEKTGECLMEDLPESERNEGLWLCPVTLEVVRYGTTYKEQGDDEHGVSKKKNDNDGEGDLVSGVKTKKERKVAKVNGIWESIGITMVEETEELLHELQKPVEERLINGKQNKKLSDLRKYPVITLTTREVDRKPAYHDVSRGATGLVEVFLLSFQPTGTTTAQEFLTEILRYFFLFHDPTTVNRQGNDKGSQYSSRIFVFSDNEEDKTALKDEEGNYVITKDRKERRKVLKNKNGAKEAFFDRNWMLTTAMSVLCDLQSMLQPTRFGMNGRDTAHVQKAYTSGIMRTTIHLVRRRKDYGREIGKLNASGVKRSFGEERMIEKERHHKTKDLLLMDQIKNDNKYTTQYIPSFFPAHEDHQSYLEVNPDGYCNHRLRMKSWPVPNTIADTAIIDTEDDGFTNIRMTEVTEGVDETKDTLDNRFSFKSDSNSSDNNDRRNLRASSSSTS
jgi:peptide methionine sulfoxide reductase MsrA